MTGGIDQAAIDKELARILASAPFARAPRARELLAYVVANGAGENARRVKEATIALDVFGRDAAKFDGDRDGIVRVAVNRLRELLDRYYANEGRECAIRLEIPRGSYAPIVRRMKVSGLPVTPRIAVLPLANFTGDSDLDALCDGLTEDLIDALAQIDSLRVIARTSSFVFKGQQRDIRKIAKTLDVDAVLEGSVQIVGEHLRITAQLILGSDGTHLWSRAFETDASDRNLLRSSLIEFMQRTLLAAVTKTEPTFSSWEASASEPEVRAYHRALYLFRRDTVEGFLGAEKTLRQLIGESPNFSRAQALLAKTLWAVSNNGERPMREATDEARRLASDAYRQTPSDDAALGAYTFFSMMSDFQPELAFEKANQWVERAPHSVDALLLHGKLAWYTAHFDASLASYDLARKLDPLSMEPLNGLTNCAICMRKPEVALALCDEVLAREPDSSYARWNRGHALRDLRRFDEARENFNNTIAKWPSTAKYSAIMNAWFLASEGRLDEARALRKLAPNDVPWRSDPITYAVLDASLGDEEAFLEEWEYGVSTRDLFVYLAHYFKDLDPYRYHPRFRATIAQMNLSNAA
jgi:adenylate cyclase